MDVFTLTCAATLLLLMNLDAGGSRVTALSCSGYGTAAGNFVGVFLLNAMIGTAGVLVASGLLRTPLGGRAQRALLAALFGVWLMAKLLYLALFFPITEIGWKLAAIASGSDGGAGFRNLDDAAANHCLMPTSIFLALLAGILAAWSLTVYVTIVVRRRLRPASEPVTAVDPSPSD